MRFTWFLSPLLGVLAIFQTSAAERVTPEALRRVADSYFAKRPAEGLPTGLSFDDAVRAQEEYVKLQIPKLGPVAGYKVGFVTKAGQERYKIDHPTRGFLLRDMLLPNKSKVPANYGTRPILEPDLIVRVKDEGINDATTPEQAARHLSHVVTFIELADATFATNATLDAGVVTAANVGARLGILGEERKFEATPEFLAAFGKMALVLKDETGRELSRVTADGMMGHPMNPLVWCHSGYEKTRKAPQSGRGDQPRLSLTASRPGKGQNIHARL
jgi:2-keto-4-pentenoate hydratase